MLKEVLDELVTTGLGLSLLGGSYLIWLLTGVANNLFNDKKWSWKRTGEDIVKTLLMCVAILAWVALCEGIQWFSAKCGCDIAALMDGASVAGVIGGIIGGTIFYAVKAYKNILDFVNANHVEVKVDNPDYHTIAENVYEVINTAKEVIAAQREFEQKEETLDGGKGVYYNVPFNTYDAFRTEVMGKGYDLDGKYLYQCWDGACLLWQQLGRWLVTGDGSARGCWQLKRDENAGKDFELIYDKNQIKRGDVVVFSCGEYGHIGYADEDYNGGAYIRLLGQNQSTDMKFCVINMSMTTFIGAFRYKQWKVTPPQPTPAPKKSVKYTYKSGDTFGAVINKLGLRTSHGLWGADGDVAYYTEQLHAQGITGNIPVGTTIELTPRK